MAASFVRSGNNPRRKRAINIETAHRRSIERCRAPKGESWDKTVAGTRGNALHQYALEVYEKTGRVMTEHQLTVALDDGTIGRWLERKHVWHEDLRPNSQTERVFETASGNNPTFVRQPDELALSIEQANRQREEERKIFENWKQKREAQRSLEQEIEAIAAGKKEIDQKALTELMKMTV